MRIEPMQTSSAGQAIPEPQLVDAAREFEAQMMKELLQPLTGMGLGRDDEAGSSDATLADLAAQALGRSMSAKGGLGIATRIIGSLSGNMRANWEPCEVSAAVSGQTGLKSTSELPISIAGRSANGDQR